MRFEMGATMLNVPNRFDRTGDAKAIAINVVDSEVVNEVKAIAYTPLHFFFETNSRIARKALGA